MALRESLTAFKQGMGTAITTENIRTAAVAGNQMRRRITDEEKAVESNKSLARLTNDKTGLFKLVRNEDGTSDYAVREDWNERLQWWGKNGTSEQQEQLAKDLNMPGLFGTTLSQDKKGNPVKRALKKIFPPLFVKGETPTSQRIAASDNSGVVPKDEDSYVIPVVTENNQFSVKTEQGTDLDDDTNALAFSSEELRAALELVPQYHQIRISPQAFRENQGLGQLAEGGFGAQGVGTNNITFTGNDGTTAVIDSAEIVAAINDPNTPTTTVVSLLKKYSDSTERKPLESSGDDTMLSSDGNTKGGGTVQPSGDQTQAGAPAPTPAPTPAPEKESIDTGEAPEPQSGNVVPRPKDRFNEWDRKFAKDYNFDGTPKISKEQVAADAAKAETERKAGLVIKDASDFRQSRGSAKNPRVSFDNIAAQEYLNGLGITLKKGRDAQKVLEALNSLEAGESISGERMGSAGLGQSVTQYLVTALGGQNSDFTASRGGGTNKRPGTYDNAAATEFIKSKLNIPEAGAVSEVQGSEEVVVKQEDVGGDDVPVNNFATNFPELVGLPANEVRNIVNGYIQDGTLAERGNFSAEQVTNVRNFLEQKNINNAEDLKDAVTRGEIRSPYVTALSITLALAGPDGKLAGGRTIADETKRLENFITTGISTATAQDLTTSMQTQQARDTASSNAFLNRVKEQNRINEALQTQFNEFTADFEKKGQLARKYFAQIKLPPEDRDKDFDSTLRSAYASWESGFEDTIRQITNNYGGIRDEGFLELWRQTERGKAGIAPTPRDMIRVLIEANAFPSDQATANIRDAMNLRVDIAAEAVFNELRGIKIPLIDGSITEWLADFPRRDEGDTGSLAQLFRDRLVVVTDASGKITKIAGKARSGGIAFQAEEDKFIDALTAGGIPLDQLSILIEEVSVEGDREIRN